MPVKGSLTKADTTYSVTADLGGFAADKLVMNQKLEASTLKVVANNAGYQVKGDVKINGQPASLDYRKPSGADADIRLQATLDDASRARLGIDLGSAVSGSIPVKVIGKIGDNDSRVGIEADLTSVKLDNILPGWVKTPGRSGKATFNVVQKAQSTRFEDIVVDGNELEDARWFDRAEATLMLKRQHPDGLAGPHPFAIAHHLLGRWVHGGNDAGA